MPCCICAQTTDGHRHIIDSYGDAEELCETSLCALMALHRRPGQTIRITPQVESESSASI